jgi:hypothetical protein
MKDRIQDQKRENDDRSSPGISTGGFDHDRRLERQRRRGPGMPALPGCGDAGGYRIPAGQTSLDPGTSRPANILREKRETQFHTLDTGLSPVVPNAGYFRSVTGPSHQPFPL